MAYKLHYSDYPGSAGPPDPAEWVGPPGPVGPMGPQGIPGQPTAGGPFLPLSGATPMTGSLIIGSGAGAPTLTLNGVAGGIKGVWWQTAGTNRWRLETSASDDLWLSGYNAAGAYTGTIASFANDGSHIGVNTTLNINATRAAAYDDVVGIYGTATNTGSYDASGHKFVYFSSANQTNFDIGFTSMAIFDPSPYVAGQQPTYEGSWVVAVSPNDTSHTWSCNVAEWNIVNRGPDNGWKRDRASAGNPTGGLLMVPEVATLAGSGGGEGKNATFAYSVGHSGGNNSTGFPARFYNGLLIEPNAIVGQTGRGIYATGDITGTASQYPYGPVQTDGTWLHGIDHTKAVYQDNSAETLAVGQAQRWITGPTTAPTGAATITGTGSGANISLALVPAGLGAVSVGTATSSGTQVNVNGAVTTKPGLSLYSGGSQRWAISLDPFPESGGNAGSNLALYNYADNGANIGNPMSILRGSGAIFIANCFGVWGTAPPATKPVISGAKGGNTALASVIALLVAYGLGSDSST